MNIWCFNHYAITPRFSGGARHYELCCALGELGHTSAVFAANFIHMSLQSLPLENNRTSQVEDFGALKFVWLSALRHRRNDWRRIANMFSYCYRAWSESRRLTHSQRLAPPDVVWGSTVHPFAALAASAIARRQGVPFIFEIRDLWPQSFIEMGLWKENSLPSIFFRQLEKICVRRARGFIVLAEATALYLEKTYAIPRSRIAVIENGVNVRAFSGAAPAGTRRPGLNLVYLGGIEHVHHLDQLLEAQSILDSEHFPSSLRLYGDGKLRETLTARYRHVSSIYWEGPVLRSQVPGILAGADVLCMSTGKISFGSENKQFEYLAAGKPIIASAQAEANQLAGRIGAGFNVPVGEPAEIAAAVRRMAALSQEERNAMGERGRRHAAETHDWPLLARRLLTLLEGVLHETLD